jgi:uncharacterized protein YdhG (YjbR/CyaY superfamily)
MIHSAIYPEIDAYIKSFPKEVQQKLEQLRTSIRNAAPDTTEAIKYGIPTFVFKGKNLVHFGGFKAHVSFFPTASPTAYFQDELSAYKCTRGTIQFPLNEPLPLELITKIVKFRIKQIIEKAGKRKPEVQ